MKKVLNVLPFVFVLGLTTYYAASNFENLNGLVVAGLTLGVLLTLYFIFTVVTEKYIDFKDGIKIKKVPKN